MLLGQKQTWNLPPQFEDQIQQDWSTWVTGTLQALQGPTTTPSATQATTVSHPGAVLVVWNEVTNASAYAIYETATQTAAPGVPLATVPANHGALANAFMRPNLNDTTTRWYSVVTITQFNRSAPSIPVPGAALSTAATVIPVSGTAINQNGVGGGQGGGGALFGVGQGPRF